jgi:predicted RNA-binding protein with PUA-like domain
MAAEAPRYWLMKSEPSVFSLADLESLGRTHWDGVRNYQARNYMKSMRVGDLVLFYHSNADPTGVAGVARVAREAHPDFTARDPASPYFDPKATQQNPLWEMVDVEFVERFPRVVSLVELKAQPGLEAMEVNRKGSRLSVQPVTPEEFRIVLGLGRRPEQAGLVTPPAGGWTAPSG